MLPRCAPISEVPSNTSAMVISAFIIPTHHIHQEYVSFCPKIWQIGTQILPSLNWPQGHIFSRSFNYPLPPEILFYSPKICIFFRKRYWNLMIFFGGKYVFFLCSPHFPISLSISLSFLTFFDSFLIPISFFSDPYFQ